MNTVANTLLLIVFASVLYGVIFSKDARRVPAHRRARREGSAATTRPVPRSLTPYEWIGQGIRDGWAAQGSTPKWK